MKPAHLGIIGGVLLIVGAWAAMRSNTLSQLPAILATPETQASAGNFMIGAIVTLTLAAAAVAAALMLANRPTADE